MVEQANQVATQHTLAVASVFSGRIDEAQRTMQEVRRIAPQMRVSRMAKRIVSHRGAYLAGPEKAYRLAGMPE